MRQGRPILFLGQVLVGWVLLRTAMAWMPGSGEPVLRPSPAVGSERQMAKRPDAPIGARVAAAEAAAMQDGSPRPATSSHKTAREAVSPDRSVPAAGLPDPAAAALLDSAMAFAQEPPGTRRLAFAAMAPGRGEGARARSGLSLAGQPAAAGSSTAVGQDRHWSGSAWLLVRSASAPGSAPLLGASQLGLRLDRTIALPGLPAARAYGRLSGPTRTPLAEGAIGMSAQPLRAVPIMAAVEARRRLASGGRSGVAIYVAGGVDARPLALGFDVDGYGQGGIVGMPGADGFVDGRLTIGRRIAGRPERVALRLAFGAEGAAQPGAARIDVGPQLEARLPLPLGAGALRLSGGWRQRIAGSAAPASGPALVLATSF